jgi:hypothetical protein
MSAASRAKRNLSDIDVVMPEKTVTNGTEETARDAASAAGAIACPQEPGKLGFMKRFLKWLSRGSEKYRMSGSSCPT